MKQMRLKTRDDVMRIRESGAILAQVFTQISILALDSLSTWELDRIIEDAIIKRKARPSFQTVKNYSYASCISVNDEVVHGLPSKKKIMRKGDIVKVDIGVVRNGYFSDRCDTFPVGKISAPARKLVKTAHECLAKGIEVLYPGRRLGDIGATIQEHAHANGFTVVRDFTGHGVGFAVHEQPNVPHYGKRNTGRFLESGMVLAVEPMINQGTYEVETCDDGWTVVTGDGMLSAQFEHTIAVTEHGPEVLTL
ncbi:MAG: type I methionyl aminopeptidase [Spirochaetes bacterium]|nr:MAG: type I methionyl aminopeptidase [Spirochaetota bacterium]